MQIACKRLVTLPQQGLYLPQTHVVVVMFLSCFPCGYLSLGRNSRAAPFKDSFVYELKWTSWVLNIYGAGGLWLDLGLFLKLKECWWIIEFSVLWTTSQHFSCPKPLTPEGTRTTDPGNTVQTCFLSLSWPQLLSLTLTWPSCRSQDCVFRSQSNSSIKL